MSCWDRPVTDEERAAILAARAEPGMTLKAACKRFDRVDSIIQRIWGGSLAGAEMTSERCAAGERPLPSGHRISASAIGLHA
jgi:transposase-like protein